MQIVNIFHNLFKSIISLPWPFHLLILVFLFLIVCAIIYRNPFKLEIVFGNKGSGKTTGCMREILRVFKRNKKRAKKRDKVLAFWSVITKEKGKLWNRVQRKYQDEAVYTNIKSCMIPGVRFINPDDLAEFVPDCNSLLIVDEAGTIWDNRLFKSFKPGFTEFFAYQRQYKVRAILLSQSYDVDKKIRDRADILWIAVKLFNCIGIWRKVIKTWKLTDPEGESEARIAEAFRYSLFLSWKYFWLPKYFKYFRSFDPPKRSPIPYTEYSVETCDATKGK